MRRFPLLTTTFVERPLIGEAAIVAAWLLARLLMSLFVHPLISGDQPGYVQAAQDFISSHGAVLARRSPAYVIFLSATQWLGPRGVYALQSLLTLGAALFTRRMLGFWQGLAIAACPFFVMWEWALLTETLCFTSLWCGWLLIFWRRSPADPLIGAVLVAVAVLARPILIGLPLVAGAVFALRRDWRRTLLVLAAAYIPIAVGLVHASGPNYVGVNLWIGSWERSPYWMVRGGDWPEEAQLTIEQRTHVASLSEASDDRQFLNAAVERYKAAPLQAITSWFVRYRFLWVGTRTEYTGPMRHTLGWFVFKASMWGLNFCILLLGLAGGVLALRRHQREVVLLAPIFYVGLVYLPFHSTEPRYSVVVVPFLLALAVYRYQLLVRPRGATA
jgi:hypothetical protein